MENQKVRMPTEAVRIIRLVQRVKVMGVEVLAQRAVKAVFNVATVELEVS
jgi:hypothetical protein